MKKTSREMICISCPIGCRLTAGVSGGEIIIEGNRCKRGIEYGRAEILAPKRVVTATAVLKGGRTARVPVKTDSPLLKEHIAPLLEMIYSIEVNAPVKLGDVVIENIGGTGVNLVATRTVRVE